MNRHGRKEPRLTDAAGSASPRDAACYPSSYCTVAWGATHVHCDLYNGTPDNPDHERITRSHNCPNTP